MAGLTTRVVRQEPSPDCNRGRVPERVWRGWDLKNKTRRRCCVCKTMYRNAGYAWSCERWHWGD